MTATDWRPVPAVEQMQALHGEDPQRFSSIFGAAGLLRIGLYANDKQRAHETGRGDTAA